MEKRETSEELRQKIIAEITFCIKMFGGNMVGPNGGNLYTISDIFAWEKSMAKRYKIDVQ